MDLLMDLLRINFSDLIFICSLLRRSSSLTFSVIFSSLISFTTETFLQDEHVIALLVQVFHPPDAFG
jgi:hypothetical protein